MPKKKKLNYQYLLSLYHRVDAYLNDDSHDKKILPEVIVSFCTVIEKILKIKLHRKNPVLVFENAKIKTDRDLCEIILGKENDVVTAKIGQVLDRFGVVFKDVLSDDEIQALREVYSIRNFFIHGYKPDDETTFDSEDITKKMGTIWGKISTQAVKLFGKEIKKTAEPKKKYSESELEEVLKKEVMEKIKLDRRYATHSLMSYGTGMGIGGGTVLSGYLGGEVCPRCGNHSFSFEPFSYTGSAFSPTAAYSAVTIEDAYLGKFSDLYRCSMCNLELTKKEYEIAKEIKGSE